jgi:CRP/FNR family transcriptional regulator, cyclic AMP receptor protein
MKKVLYIFGQLSDNDIEWLINSGTKEKIPEGEILIKKGDIVENLFIVLDGEFAILAGKNNEKKITELESGEIIGEMSFVDSTPPIVDVKALRDSFVYKISRIKLNEKIEKDVSFSAHFYKAISIFLADRLRANISHIGYGNVNEADNSNNYSGKELDFMIMDNVSIAGERFQRMLKAMTMH